MPDRILVFIPCYNCAPQIGRVLKQFSGAAGRRFEEILVLDNRSTDGTLDAAVSGSAGVVNARVTIARNLENYNLGGSHKAAFAYAASKGYSHVVVLHGDDQGDIEDLMPLLDSGQHRFIDGCLGARFMPGSRLMGYSRFRVFGNHVFNSLFSLVTRTPVYDLGSGLNIFGARLFQLANLMGFADDLRFSIYMLLSAIDQKLTLRYFPISWREDDQISNVKMTSQALKTLQIMGTYVFRRQFLRTRDHRSKPYVRYEFEVIKSTSPEPREVLTL